MPRPSIKARRTAEILEAFKRCIAKYGLEGSSLELLAQEANLQRSLIRHFVGNRDDLIHLLAAKILTEFTQQTDALYAHLPEQNRIVTLIEQLLDPSHASSTEHILVFESLIAAAERYPNIRIQLQQWLEHYTHQLTVAIQDDYPTVSEKHCKAVSFAIISLYFNLDSLSPLALSAHYRDSAIFAAKQLLLTLEIAQNQPQAHT